MPTALQIRTELDADSKSLGYAGLRDDSNAPQALAAKLNEPGASAETLFKTYVAMEDVLACIVLTEFNALSAAGKTACDMFLRGARLRSGDANMRTTMAALFAAGATRTALIALASRAASRAEALWGEGVTVTDTEVSLALELAI